MFSVGITGVGSFVPDDILTNADLEKMVETTDKWITSRTGIKERRIVKEGVPVSELCYQAGLRALEDAGMTGEDIDLVIVATVTPDYMFPATACLVADRLGLYKSAAFDMEAGCSGFIYALATASQFIQTGMYRSALVIGGETLSKVLNWEDRSTCVLFGDGAGAAVLRPVEKGYGFLGCDLGADGSGAKLLIQPAGGSQIPASLDSVQKKLHTLQMAGSEVFKFAVRVIEESTNNVLAKAGLKKEDIDLFLPHQANIRIVEAAFKRLGISMEKALLNLDRYGNTSAASIPLAMEEAVRTNRLCYGDIVTMVGFGAGLTWGSIILKWARKGERE